MTKMILKLSTFIDIYTWSSIIILYTEYSKYHETICRTLVDYNNLKFIDMNLYVLLVDLYIISLRILIESLFNSILFRIEDMCTSFVDTHTIILGTML